MFCKRSCETYSAIEWHLFRVAMLILLALEAAKLIASQVPAWLVSWLSR